MEQTLSNVNPTWIRENNNFLRPKDIGLFHSILLLVENDDPSRFKGYNWAKLKKTLGKSIDFKNSTTQENIEIPSKIENNTIYFRESKTIASNFFKMFETCVCS
jgi:hypothetical protein